MNKLTGEFNKDIELIKEKVNEKIIPVYKCPICGIGGAENIEVVAGYFANTVQPTLYSLNFGGNSIPALGIICKNCNSIQQFALGGLGLLPERKNK